MIYFTDDRDYRGELPIILDLMDVSQNGREYAVFVGYASDPKSEGYLTQLRIITPFHRLFGVTIGETRELTSQPMTIGELVCGFVETHREEWNSSPVGFCENLGFGFMVESVSYFGNISPLAPLLPDLIQCPFNVTRVRTVVSRLIVCSSFFTKDAFQRRHNLLRRWPNSDQRSSRIFTSRMPFVSKPLQKSGNGCLTFSAKAPQGVCCQAFFLWIIVIRSFRIYR